MDWREHISSVAAVCHGKACVTGTRIMVSVVLDCLASGMTVAQILEEYPTLRADSILACVAYAAELARERRVPLPGSAA